jgi:DNA repair protein RecO (recombination protein O)
MQWTSEAIIIKQQQFSDDKLLCWLFSATHGLYKGLLTLNKKTRNQIQIGNIVNATWRARLPEHLGSYYCELIRPLSMAIINDKLKLSSVSSICSILSDCLPEKILEAKIYDHFISYLLTLKDHQNWLIEYLRLELIILKEMGYGLGLDSCALTGVKEGLYYVSPKTGMAVTKLAGAPYSDKLFRLPKFLHENEEGEKEDIIDAFKLNAHFLYKRLYQPRSMMLSVNRNRFSELFFK